MYIPSKDDLAGWVRLLDEAHWYSLFDMMAIHKGLHRLFGAEPSDALLEGERKLSLALANNGLPHRYKDELSAKAGTTPAELPAPTVYEVQLYMEDTLMQSGAVQLIQDVEEGGPIYLHISDKFLPESTRKHLVRSINRSMPPGVTLKKLPSKPPGEFAVVTAAHDIVLRATFGNIQVFPWSSLIASAPAAIFKSADQAAKKINLGPGRIVALGNPMQARVEKAADVEYEQFLLAEVLVPEEEDPQKEIYSHADVRKACHWWVENSGNFSIHHVLQGGEPASPGDIVMLENYIMPATCEIQGSTIKAGTWMLGTSIRDTSLWQRCLSGEFNAYSIGATAVVEEEYV